LLTSEAEVKVLNQLRHALADENQEEGLESVLKRLGETSSNVEFLTLVQRGRG
jgi:transcription termination factor Rho